MKWMFGKAGLWLWITVISAAGAFAAGAVQLPEGPGKATVESACTSCHEIEMHVQDKHYTKEEWESTIQSMRDMGAAVSDDDFKVIAEYLTKNFGKGDAAAATAPSAAEVKKLVEETCTACHGMDLISSTPRDKDGWKNVVEGMVGLGAQLKDEQIPVVVDYLTKTYGSQ